MSEGPAHGRSHPPDPPPVDPRDPAGQPDKRSLREIEANTDDPLIYGLFLVAVSGLFSIGILNMEARPPSRGDPGPRAFPLGLAVVLGAAGVGLAAGGWRSRASRLSPTTAVPGTGSWVRPLTTLVGVTLCAASMSWIGYGPALSLLSLLLLKSWGASWPGALVTAAMLVGVVDLLFVRVFRVLLPMGSLF